MVASISKSANSIITVGQLTSEMPAAAKIFQSFGIDYCCGGNRSIEAACAAAGVPVETVWQMLSEAEQAQSFDNFIDWRKRALSDLIDYIVTQHHVFTRNQLEFIAPLLAKVSQKHSEHHPELLQVNYIFQALCEDLMPHMLKEEEVLFPYIKALESRQDRAVKLPQVCFGSVSTPVQRMMLEHDVAGELLLEIRAVSGDFNPPEDGCNSYKALYQALKELEQDLHEHIHLENNLLFPRAIELEQRCSAQL